MATQQQSYWTQRTLQAAYVAQQTPGILCLKSKQKLIDAKRLCSEMSETIVPLPVIVPNLVDVMGQECGPQITTPQKVIQDLQLLALSMVTPKARL